MKRKYANRIPGEYTQEYINNDYFTGYACYTKLKDIDKPLVVNNGLYDLCIMDNDFLWIMLFPDNDNYVLTIMYDNNYNLIQWYFDVSYNISFDNGIPYEDDLYLDMIITKEEQELILDEDELMNAFSNGEITKEDVDNAYKVLRYLENKYFNNIEELKEFTNRLIKNIRRVK